jgi:transposase
MRPRGSAEELERRRRRAVAWVQEGLGIREVARRVGASPGAVVRWRDAFLSRGDEGLRAKPRDGTKLRKLSLAQRRRLIRLLLRGPTAHGYRTDLWTLRRVAEVIERHFRVQYHPGHVWKILRQLDWTAQKPERRARERDEPAIARWRTHDWPRIKKRHKNRS